MSFFLNRSRPETTELLSHLEKQKISEAEEHFRGMLDSRSAQTEDCNLMLDTFGLNGELDKMISLFELMSLFKIPYNTKSYGTMINRLSMARRWVESEQYFQQALKSCFSDSPEIWVAHMRMLSYSFQAEKLWETYHQMMERKITFYESHYCALLKGLAKTGQYKKMMEVLARMRKSKVLLISRSITDICFLLESRLDTNNREEIHSVAQAVKDAEHKEVKETTSQMRQASQLGEMWQSSAPDLASCAALIGGLARTGKYKEACEKFDELFQLGKKNEVLFIVMIDAAGHAKDVTRVKQLVRQLEGLGKVSANAWDSVIEAFMRNDDHLAAVMAFKQCQQMGIHWNTKMRRTFFSFIRVCPASCQEELSRSKVPYSVLRSLTVDEVEDLSRFLANYEAELRGGFQPVKRNGPSPYRAQGF